MGNTIQIKTGSGAPKGILVKGELGFDTTNKKLYIGLGETNPFMVTADYLPLNGGKMIGPISFQSSSLPDKTLEFVCGIDSFANGGELGRQSKDNFLSGYAKTSDLANYVTTNTAQTIVAAKTFDGEQKYYNTSYCPTITDTASGVGCAFKASRGLFNEALIDKIIMTSSTKKIPFYKYTGTSGGAMSGLTEVASIDTSGNATFNGAIHIKSTADASADSESTIPPLTIGDRNGSHIIIDGNEIISKNGTGTMQTLYLQDTGGETKACGDFVVAGKIKGIIKQLWTNSNSSATFTAQDISLNYSGYNTLILIFRRRTDSATCCTVTIPATSGANYQSIINYISGNTAKIQKRDFTINASSISFGAGWQQGSTNGTDNNANIPVAIWAF